MNAHTHAELASALQVVIGGHGSLSLRLFCVASSLIALSPRAFNDDPCLREWFQSLCDDFVFNGLVNDGPDGPVTNLDPEAAMILALRLVEFCHAVAVECDANEE